MTATTATTLTECAVRIRAERRRRGESIYRLAVRTGLHPNTVGLAERGAASVATTARIAAALGIAFQVPEVAR